MIINKKKVYKDNLEYNIFEERTDQNKFLTNQRLDNFQIDLEKFQILNNNTIKMIQENMIEEYKNWLNEQT